MIKKGYIGIDIAKSKFDVTLLMEESKERKRFENNEKGYDGLVKWIKERVEEVHICMEATGVYWVKVAEYLYKKGYKVSVINPSIIKAYAGTQMSRNKTDEQDSKLLAKYCKSENPRLFKPTEEVIKKLQALTRRRNTLIELIDQESNRKDTVMEEVVIKSHQKIIELLEKELEEIEELADKHVEENLELKENEKLLCSIPGIGKKTAQILLAELIMIENYENARQAAAYAGLTPKQFSSGSSVRGKTRLSKVGNSKLRKALYWPAISAIRYNPIIKDFAQRLSKQSKSKMVIIGAAMRKLIHLAFGILRHRTPFDPNFLLHSS